MADTRRMDAEPLCPYAPCGRAWADHTIEQRRYCHEASVEAMILDGPPPSTGPRDMGAVAVLAILAASVAVMFFATYGVIRLVSG